MAITISKKTEWRAGAGTPIKYSFEFNGTSDLISISGTTATFNLIGTVTIVNHPYNSQNSWPASDFAVLGPADKNPGDYGFTAGTSYYQQGLPFLPNAPQSYTNAVLVEFRGDTYSPNPNASSLYVKNSGIVLNQDTSEFTRDYPVNLEFTVELTGSPDQPVIAWIQSGANNSTSYQWLDPQIWATLLDYDYIPGKTFNGSNWLSHNRSVNGHAKIYNGSSWSDDMRTVDGGSGSGNPPLIRHPNAWLNQRKVGQE